MILYLPDLRQEGKGMGEGEGKDGVVDVTASGYVLFFKEDTPKIELKMILILSIKIFVILIYKNCVILIYKKIV